MCVLCKSNALFTLLTHTVECLENLFLYICSRSSIFVLPPTVNVWETVKKERNNVLMKATVIDFLLLSVINEWMERLPNKSRDLRSSLKMFCYFIMILPLLIFQSIHQLWQVLFQNRALTYPEGKYLIIVRRNTEMSMLMIDLTARRISEFLIPLDPIRTTATI